MADHGLILGPALYAASPGILTTLAFWALWFLLDPGLRPEHTSWPRLLLWLLAPLGMYVVLSRHSHPTDPPPPPVGKDGIVTRLAPFQVEVSGSFWQARYSGPREPRVGERVRVAKREGLSLVVEPLS